MFQNLNRNNIHLNYNRTRFNLIFFLQDLQKIFNSNVWKTHVFNLIPLHRHHIFNRVNYQVQCGECKLKQIFLAVVFKKDPHTVFNLTENGWNKNNERVVPQLEFLYLSTQWQKRTQRHKNMTNEQHYRNSLLFYKTLTFAVRTVRDKDKHLLSWKVQTPTLLLNNLTRGVSGNWPSVCLKFKNIIFFQRLLSQLKTVLNMR